MKDPNGSWHMVGEIDGRFLLPPHLFHLLDCSLIILFINVFSPPPVPSLIKFYSFNCMFNT